MHPEGAWEAEQGWSTKAQGDSAMGAFAEELERLDKSLHQLRQRIDPVLRSVPAPPDSVEKASYQTQLRDHLAHLSALNRQLADMIDRIDL